MKMQNQFKGICILKKGLSNEEAAKEKRKLPCHMIACDGKLNKDEKVELHITYLEVRHQIPS